eukprot:TRINITY_DN11909_c0_g1_i1.p1 TRINITY_DN11909_c0_g1~~TRINITY_DN11909_c0_g1_i1.p1  ORF type:complete len:293 (-),score=71.65 TRINITY_DN11909_c0_g1_i1:174-1052(-)
MAMVTVECSDHALIDVNKEMMMSMSEAFKRQLTAPNPPSVISLENISENTLVKVLEFCNVHTSPGTIPNLQIWDEKFVRLEPPDLCELASAAYHLEIKPLVDLTCKAIAKLLKGKSPAEIRRTFNILYDFSPGDDAPPPTIRDKLRNKLHYSQKKKDVEKDTSDTNEDTRSVNDLLSFIDGQNPKKSKKSKQKSKKNGKHKRNVSDESNKLEKSGEYEIDEQNESHEHSLNDSGNISDDEEIDPELKAEQDREVEEFRRRLESIQTTERRPKITIPYSNLESLVKNNVVVSK